ncbi:hypothetical protein ACFOTA_16570 [Chitinophaga sp. GCM10012297]|uniref:ExsA-like N-terminal regulatory domain-containing protein n=1 Tax=Chitinophaga chungangae TaxID=2821488 RepID=A0ABS3YGN6_9BACT|nr:hypothetical protein [Chitinophaga chungangae]MBO9153836.1 hypothetical protein [Chitinophaga chungangae]
MDTKFISRKGNETKTRESAGGIYYFNRQIADEGSLCPEENIIVAIMEGGFIFHHESAAFETKAPQLVFLRQNTLVKYQALSNQPSFLLFVLKKDIVEEFVRSAPLTSARRRQPETVLVHEPSQDVSEYIASVTACFSGDTGILAHVERANLLGLLYCLSFNAQNHPLLEQAAGVRAYTVPL